MNKFDEPLKDKGDTALKREGPILNTIQLAHLNIYLIDHERLELKDPIRGYNIVALTKDHQFLWRIERPGDSFVDRYGALYFTGYSSIHVDPSGTLVCHSTAAVAQIDPSNGKIISEMWNK